MSLPFGSFLNQSDVRETNVSTKGDISYYSLHPSDFIRGADGEQYTINTITYTCDDTQTLFTPIHLPNGAVVISVVIYGSETDEQFFLSRSNMDGSTAAEAMTSENVGTIADSISDPTIDNSNYNYSIQITQQVATDVIYGGVIIYTT